jgi:hypothetical protein
MEGALAFHTTDNVSKTSIFLFFLFSHVASEFVASFQAKTRTLGGAGQPQIAFQMALRPFGALLMVPWVGRCSSSMPSQYAKELWKVGGRNF